MIRYLGKRKGRLNWWEKTGTCNRIFNDMITDITEMKCRKRKRIVQLEKIYITTSKRLLTRKVGVRN